MDSANQGTASMDNATQDSTKQVNAKSNDAKQADAENKQSQEESKVAQRGNTSHLPPAKHDNIVLMFGARGGSGVNANTAMCKEIADIFMRFDRQTLRTYIPTAFENFSG